LSLKRDIARQIDRLFEDTPELRKLLRRMLDESPTPRAFESKLYYLTSRLTFFDSDFYRSNWHSLNCECDECMKLSYGGLVDE